MAKIQVFMNKNEHGSWSVREFTFDKNGNTVNMRLCGNGLSYREALQLKRDVIESYM